uniref:Trafficking protein particle complex subunit n=1 Tax=Zea mays TaxID=4577 RepID=C0HEN0_MAIZE|nr:unknown [Zea mays]
MPPAPKSGDALFASVDRVNAELFTLTYGAIVRQLLTDLEEVEEVNKQLDQMGYNIGTRLVDEFLAKSNVSRCVDFKETADVIAKVFAKTSRQYIAAEPTVFVPIWHSIS